MRRLLRANFARLLKNKLFWILTCAELFLGALFPILHYMDNIDENRDSAFGMVRVRCTYAYVLCISDIYYDSSMYSNIYFDIYVVQ